jgi:hypothetical protein
LRRVVDSTIEVRRFCRDDREEVTHLLNIYAGAVNPGMATSVNTVMSQLERGPGGIIVDTRVMERTTFVAEQRGRIVVAPARRRWPQPEGQPRAVWRDTDR